MTAAKIFVPHPSSGKRWRWETRQENAHDPVADAMLHFFLLPDHLTGLLRASVHVAVFSSYLLQMRLPKR